MKITNFPEKIQTILEENRKAVYLFFHGFKNLDKPFLPSSDVVDIFEDITGKESGKSLKESAFEQMILSVEECSIRFPFVCFAVRRDPSHWHYIRFHMEDIFMEEISVAEFLMFKESIVEPTRAPDESLLELDFEPFVREFPRMRETRSIGRGVEFLNRALSGRMFSQQKEGFEKLLQFLRLHHFNGQPLMLSKRIDDVSTLREALRGAMKELDKYDLDSEWNEFSSQLQNLGFLPGWGKTAERVMDSLQLLSDILEAPDPGLLERFLARVPMIFRLVIMSPHGFLGQSHVLGKPDTGGQVVYILNQVRALEKEMTLQIEEQGLDINPEILIVTRLIPESQGTTCNQPMEPVAGTRNAKILRVPFREPSGDVVPQWISRFEVWPYLERFSLEAEREIIRKMGTKPDLVIGNYSDGNIVAYMLAQRIGVTQCIIAHALEKSKYLYSDLYWKKMDSQYHFSIQFTADLLAMNSADFIITSTYQEIAGTNSSAGQYESYSAFTMPDLYRVINGVDIFDPKFNIVSPGADDGAFFSCRDQDRRLTDLSDEINKLIFGEPADNSRGCLKDKDKPLLFTMARFDRIKNITGLVEWYGQSKELRERANLLVAGGFIDVNKSQDEEEKLQINRLHELMDQYQLDDQIRWVEFLPDKNFVGELYRIVADTKGAFAQPALFEAFGLTVVEAMSSGLPVFATCYGGPLEIIQDGKSGFHINPNQGEKSAEKISAFFERCRNEPGYWETISQNSIDRVEERYTWRLYAKRLMTLSRIYGFWRFITRSERQENNRYLEMFYNLMYKRLAKKLQKN